ncbi:glycoside hydrolase family protein [Pontiellaceae bacterium B1224]|nr:glycoside hydrolase family protein [Pontiellaceae bacterium B1224]
MKRICALFLLLGFSAFAERGGAVDRSFANCLEYVGVAVEEPDWNPWGSSPVIGPDGKIHLFVARWPIREGFGAWKTHCEIARYVGDDPEGPFVFKEVVVKDADPKTAGRNSPHNPNIQKVDDQYVLTFITNAGGKTGKLASTQGIAMWVADSLEGPWTPMGENGLIFDIPEDPSVWSHGSVVGVTNPAFLAHPDGRFFLYYKAMRKGDVRRMGVAIADQLEGPYIPEKNSLTSNKSEIEDGYAFVDEEGKICLLTTHNKAGTGYLWKSDDGLHFDDPIPGFDKMNQYVSQETIDNTTRPHAALFGRPQLLSQDGTPTHLYVASGVNFTGGLGTHSCVMRIHDPE